MKLWIAIPSYDGEAISPFRKSLTDTVNLFKDNGVEIVNIDTVSGCCYLPVVRNRLVRRFMDSRADTLLFLDADLSWRPKELLEFVQHDKCVLAGIYRMKTGNEMYPCLIEHDNNFNPVVRDGLIKAHSVPTGCLKIKKEVFDTIIEYYEEDLEIDEPNEQHDALIFAYWNIFDCAKIGRRWIGEDYKFCHTWRSLGGDIWIYPNMTFGHHTNDLQASFYGNFHNFLTRQPGGSHSGPVNYEDYKESGIEGFMNMSELQFLYQESSKYDSIIEIGSFKGRSTHALLSGLSKKVYCVDSWNYNKEITCDEDTFNEFKSNISLLAGNNGRLNINRLSSLEAAKLLPDVDMVFIDADHSYESVKADILAWLPKTKKLISGHDYAPNWPGVKQAVDEIFGDNVKLVDLVWYVEIGE
jgi:hypothetical protein